MEIHILNSKVISAIKQVLNRTDFCECIIRNESEMILKNDQFERVGLYNIWTLTIWFDHRTNIYSFKISGKYITVYNTDDDVDVKIESYE